MRQTGKSKTCVWRWQERFMSEGVDGLFRDKTRPSRIAPLAPEVAERVVALSLTDAPYLSDAIIGYFKRADNDGIAGYSEKALARVWKAERFSRSLTKLMHRFPDDGPFERRMQVAELDYIAGSIAAQTSIAENYVGLPI